MIVTTSTHLEGYKVTDQLGIVRGITVRSRGIGGNFMGGLQTLVGGRNTVYTDLCEQSRQEAYDLLIFHAQQVGANAILSMRYDANEVIQGVTEVLAYGTAVKVVKTEG
jgi:uncharacterized protein YbjQ (UPF0145 family)